MLNFLQGKSRWLLTGLLLAFGVLAIAATPTLFVQDVYAMEDPENPDPCEQ